jgi:hypothetical protein
MERLGLESLGKIMKSFRHHHLTFAFFYRCGEEFHLNP